MFASETKSIEQKKQLIIFLMRQYNTFLVRTSTEAEYKRN